MRGASPGIPYNEQVTLVIAVSVEGRVQGKKLRWLRQLTKEEQDKQIQQIGPAREEYKSSPASNADQKLHYREPTTTGSLVMLKLYRDGQWRKWTDRDGFNPRRFNPDTFVRSEAADREARRRSWGSLLACGGSAGN